MADTQGQETTNEGPSEEMLIEARTMGWQDKESFKGNPEDWVPAEEYVNRGRQIMPILRENNKKMQGEIGALKGRVESMSTALQAANTTIKLLEDSHAQDVQQQVEAARAQLRDEIAAASRDGDHDALAQATDKLTQLNSANKAAGGESSKSDTTTTTTTAPQIHPEAVQWRADNADFVADKRKMRLATIIAQELRDEGDLSVGKIFLDRVAQQVEDTLNGKNSRGTSKVESGQGGGSRRSSAAGAGGKSYADLPAEAKDACERFAKRMVGPDRAHKDINSWRNSYAKQFFEQDA